jgi:hypothetical protein
MKKIIGILTIAAFSTFNANAEVLSVGITGNAGILDAQGKETFNGTTNTRSEELGMAYASGFAELHLPMPVGPGKLRAGISYVPYPLESETTTREEAEGESHADQGDGVVNPRAAFTQKVQVDIENLTSMYASYHVDMFSGTGFVKAGIMEADVITNENLESGSAYGNTDLSGTFWALGFDKPLFDDMFVRAEVSATEFDAIKLTSTGSDNSNVIDITGLEGTNIAFSVGKSF